MLTNPHVADESGTVDTLQRSGNVIQVVNFQTGAVATGTGTIPQDDTIPQITEGNEFMTLAITPTNASNILLIEVHTNSSNSAPGGDINCALFMNAIADALASKFHHQSAGTGAMSHDFIHKMTAGATSAITFRVRIGANAAATTTFNGQSGARRYGGTLASSITITEYTP